MGPIQWKSENAAPTSVVLERRIAALSSTTCKKVAIHQRVQRVRFRDATSVIIS